MSTRLPIVNWARNVSFCAAELHRPESLDELRRLVASRQRIRALGAGHSFSRVADCADDLVRLDRLPRLIQIDREDRSVTVAAGLSYAQLAPVLHRNGAALANLASLSTISLAGSCATGTHGSGDIQPSLAAAVTGLQLVTAEGDLVELRPGRAGDNVAGAVVALGALGIVTALRLAIEPSFDVAQRVRLAVPLDEVADRLTQVLAAAYSVSVFTDWQSDQANVWLKERIGRPGSGWAGGRAARAPVHPVPGMDPAVGTPQLGVVGPWHERLPHFRAECAPAAGNELQSEYFLPRAAAPAAIAAIRGLAKLVAPVLQISELRSVRADDLWLSPAYGHDCVTFHFTWIEDATSVWPVLRAVEEVLIPFGARPHWGKLTALPAPLLLSRYPRGADFRHLVDSMDPKGKFRSPFVEGLLSTG